MKTNYARNITDKFEGIRPLAKLMGLDPTTIFNWIDRGGRIPRWHHERLLMLAKEHGVKLKREELGPSYK